MKNVDYTNKITNYINFRTCADRHMTNDYDEINLTIMKKSINRLSPSSKEINKKQIIE